MSSEVSIRLLLPEEELSLVRSQLQETQWMSVASPMSSLSRLERERDSRLAFQLLITSLTSSEITSIRHK